MRPERSHSSRISKISYVSDLGAHIQAAWVGFEKNQICVVQTHMKKSEAGCKGAKKIGFEMHWAAV